MRKKKVNWSRLPFLSLFPLLDITLNFCTLLFFVAKDVPWQKVEFPEHNLRIYTNGDIITDPLCKSFILRQGKEIFPHILFVKDFELGKCTERQNCSRFSYQILNKNEIIIKSKIKDTEKQEEELRFYLKDNVYY